MINYEENKIIDDNKVLDSIIKYKHEPGKQLLRNCRDYVIEDYEHYKFNSKTLEKIIPDTRIINQAGDILRDTYKNNPKGLQDAKEQIKIGLPKLVQAKCPYCMISAHSTFDHYLDKSNYPEYSLFSLNLIPCCAECNTLKNDLFLDELGQRMFISFMFDKLPEYPFLRFKIGLNCGNLYLDNIYLDLKVNSSVNNIIENHFNKLKLYKRLRNQFNNEVSVLVLEFKEYKLDRKMVELLLQKKIVAWEKSKGINNWEVCILRGLLDNTDIIEFLCA